MNTLHEPAFQERVNLNPTVVWSLENGSETCSFRENEKDQEMKHIR